MIGNKVCRWIDTEEEDDDSYGKCLILGDFCPFMGNERDCEHYS